MIDIKYSQNFYKNINNLERIIKSLNLKPSDIVIDIGAGTGNITFELAKYSNNVIAYELDITLFNRLKERFSEYKNVTLRNTDFLTTKLPTKQYKVFSNIPFSISSDILKKITDINSSLKEGYIFVQKETSQRYMGIPINTQISTILAYRYYISVIEEFRRDDFKPIPSVDIVLLKVERKEILEKDYSLYRDFVTYIFNQRNSNVLDTFKKLFTFSQLKHIKKYLSRYGYIKPSQIPIEYYLEIFKYFKSNGSKYMNMVNGYYIKHSLQHSKREGVNRTRVRRLAIEIS